MAYKIVKNELHGKSVTGEELADIIALKKELVSGYQSRKQ